MAAESLTEKRPSSDEGLSLRKRSRKETSEPLANALGSTTRVPSGKGKESVAIEEAPKRGNTLRELYEVEDRVGSEKYFATIMTRLKVTEGEDPLMPRWSAIVGSSQFWTEGPLSREYLCRTLHPTLAKQGLHFVTALIDQVHDAGRLVRSQHERILALRVANKELKGQADQDLVAVVESRAKELQGNTNKLRGELESLKTQWRRLEEEVRILRSSLDGARNDWACLEGDVLSMTEAAMLLEAELKGEGKKAVTAYKTSRGLESGLEKIG
ncbi:hypothetical protein BHM03_00040149 [Ensete ventricosum]|nr:hypothetical protein BHM03_00040149 [Ensete ventricosum]